MNLFYMIDILGGGFIPIKTVKRQWSQLVGYWHFSPSSHYELWDYLVSYTILAVRKNIVLILLVYS